MEDLDKKIQILVQKKLNNFFHENHGVHIADALTEYFRKRRKNEARAIDGEITWQDAYETNIQLRAEFETIENKQLSIFSTVKDRINEKIEEEIKVIILHGIKTVSDPAAH